MKLIFVSLLFIFCLHSGLALPVDTNGLTIPAGVLGAIPTTPGTNIRIDRTGKTTKYEIVSGNVISQSKMIDHETGAITNNPLPVDHKITVPSRVLDSIPRPSDSNCEITIRNIAGTTKYDIPWEGDITRYGTISHLGVREHHYTFDRGEKKNDSRDKR